jgi:hypothetical protein
LKPFIGEDPLMTERLWARIREFDRIEEMSVAHQASWMMPSSAAIIRRRDKSETALIS